jgi:hypothetical protein
MAPGADQVPLKTLSGAADAARNVKENLLRTSAHVNSSVRHTHEPVQFRTSSGSTQAAPSSLALPSTTATLFTALELQQSLPVHVRILIPAAATSKAINESSHRSSLNIKAEPGTKLQEPYIKQEVAAEHGHTHHRHPATRSAQSTTRAACSARRSSSCMVLVAELDAVLTCSKTCSSDVSVGRPARLSQHLPRLDHFHHH